MAECYMCSAKPVSNEHVPPLCIFPESKDIPEGHNYRKNLITVPSCAEHNLRKSNDDEYLLFILVSNWNTNYVGLRQWKTKVLRSFKYKPTKLGIYKNIKPISINGINTATFEPDMNRLSEEIIKISRGIYYYHFSKQWLHPMDIAFPAALRMTGTNPEEYNSRIRLVSNMIATYLINEPVCGENPNVFWYKYKVDLAAPYYFLQMVFYGGITISSSSPQHRI